MKFGQALIALENGSKVQRQGWNVKGMSVVLVKEENIETDKDITLEPFLVIQNVKGTFNTWVPSISDLLADDWEIISNLGGNA